MSYEFDLRGFGAIASQRTGGSPRNRVSSVTRLSPENTVVSRRVTIPVVNVDEILRRCPTSEERRMIRRDFNIYFDNTVPASVYGTLECTYGGNESGGMLAVYNAFRLMKYINFDEPMPLINKTNMYDWLKGLGLSYQITTRENSAAGGDKIFLRWQAFSEPWLRRWHDSQLGIGIRVLIALILHEARHTDNGGGKHHLCEVAVDGGSGTIWNDSTLQYGGAWALQYWYYRWLAEHSGGYLSQLQKEEALDNAEQILQRICNPLGV